VLVVLQCRYGGLLFVVLVCYEILWSFVSYLYTIGGSMLMRVRFYGHSYAFGVSAGMIP